MAGEDTTPNNNTISENKNVYEYALRYLNLGLSVIPLKPRTKEPLIPWKEFQERLPTKEEVREWFKGKDNNIGVVCGRVSGNLVVIDFDNVDKFNEWYEKVDKLGLRDLVLNTWIVETGKGIHVYFRVNVSPEEFTKLFRTRVRFTEGVDVKSEGGYVVAPPSIHPNGKCYEFRTPYNDIVELDVKTFNELIGSLKPLEPRGVEEVKEEVRVEPLQELRELSDSQLLKLKELLKDAYVPGQRQLLVLYLSGWLAKAKISPTSAVKLIKTLYEETSDNDPLKIRLSAVVYSYKKMGIDVDKYANEIETLTGIKPYGFEREISEEEVKGKTGIQELFEATLGEAQALDIIREIEEILGVASPYRDSIIEILDYEKQLYAIANLRKLVVVRGRKEGNTIKYKERVSVGAPTAVEVYINPIGSVTKYKVKWEAATRPKPIEIGPALIEDIVSRLVAEGLIVNRRLAGDVITAIVEGFIRKKKAVIKTELDAAGFYLVDGKVVAVGYQAEKPGQEELRKALELLNELADNWFHHVKERFSLVVKWGLMAPFSFIYKQKGKWVQWLYLYGSSYTGKTTLGEIILAIWGLGAESKKTGASIDTPARLGHVLSRSTFPVLINEPGAALREDIVEIIKNAVESEIVRGRFERGSYTEIPALAALMFTSNKILPRDDALLRRFIVLRFTYGERILQEKAREFDAKVRPQLIKLNAVGRYVAAVITANPSILEQDWVKAAEAILESAFKDAGMTPPSWLYEVLQIEENIYDDMREAIRNYLVKRLNDEYNRFIGRISVFKVDNAEERFEFLSRHEVSYTERVKILLNARVIPWLMLVDGEVLLLTGFVDELKSIVGDAGGLKTVAELLGWEYKKVTLRMGKKVTSSMCVAVPFDDFISFLYPEEEKHTLEQKTLFPQPTQ